MVATARSLTDGIAPARVPLLQKQEIRCSIEPGKLVSRRPALMPRALRAGWDVFQLTVNCEANPLIDAPRRPWSVRAMDRAKRCAETSKS
jgi:hypothetical protein